MINKIIIGFFILMTLFFVGIVIKVKMYFHAIEIEVINSQKIYNKHIKMLDSTLNLENVKQKLRVEYAEKLETELKRNRKIFVSTSGNRNEYLTLTCYFFNENSLNEESIKNSINTWKKLGFKKVTITDGYQNSYSLKLQ